VHRFSRFPTSVRSGGGVIGEVFPRQAIYIFSQFDLTPSPAFEAVSLVDVTTGSGYPSPCTLPPCGKYDAASGLRYLSKIVLSGGRLVLPA